MEFQEEAQNAESGWTLALRNWHLDIQRLLATYHTPQEEHRNKAAQNQSTDRADTRLPAVFGIADLEILDMPGKKLEARTWLAPRWCIGPKHGEDPHIDLV